MSLVSIAAQNASLAMSYGVDAGSLAPANLEVALFVGDPALDGVEVTGGGYARVTVPNDVTTWPDAPADGSVTSAEISFVASSGAWSDTATHWLLLDDATGDEWDSGVLADPITVGGSGVVARPSLTVFYEDPDLGA